MTTSKNTATNSPGFLIYSTAIFCSLRKTPEFLTLPCLEPPSNLTVYRLMGPVLWVHERYPVLLTAVDTQVEKVPFWGPIPLQCLNVRSDQQSFFVFNPSLVIYDATGFRGRLCRTSVYPHLYCVYFANK
jgi:hypothetical protein